MILKNDYKQCLTNLACSIQKYFEIEPKHDSLKLIDDILEKEQPKNVVLILFDGMGSRIIKRNLNFNDFFLQKQIAEITSVYPATTTAATTSVRTGLNPIEHGWLGWDSYLANIDKTITLFLGTEKGKKDKCEQFEKFLDDFDPEPISSMINKKGYIAHEISHYGDIDYKDMDDMISKIEEQCSLEGKKFLYVYDAEPDSSMHKYGPDSQQVISLLRERNDKIEKMCQDLKNTLVIVVADHGHIVAHDIHLEQYPQFTRMLQRTTSIETRACSFKVKEEYKDVFVDKFNELFGKWFILLNKQQVKDIGLFGPGKPHELFDEEIGDYLAVAIDKYNLLTEGNFPLYSVHAGYTDDEVYVPLIVNMCR